MHFRTWFSNLNFFLFTQSVLNFVLMISLEKRVLCQQSHGHILRKKLKFNSAATQLAFLRFSTFFLSELKVSLTGCNFIYSQVSTHPPNVHHPLDHVWHVSLCLRKCSAWSFYDANKDSLVFFIILLPDK